MNELVKLYKLLTLKRSCLHFYHRLDFRAGLFGDSRRYFISIQLIICFTCPVFSSYILWVILALACDDLRLSLFVMYAVLPLFPFGLGEWLFSANRTRRSLDIQCWLELCMCEFLFMPARLPPCEAPYLTCISQAPSPVTTFPSTNIGFPFPLLTPVRIVRSVFLLTHPDCSKSSHSFLQLDCLVKSG